MDVLVAAEVLRRVKRTRQAVGLVSQVIIRAYEEEALHAEVCRNLVAHGGYLMAWIGLAETQPERIIRPVAHEGLEPNFLQALKITWSNDMENNAPTSRAVQEQRPQVARNILKEPRFAVLRQEAQLYGYTATCALPLQFAQYGMGVLTIHAVEPDAFNAEEVSLLRELAGDLSAGIIGLRERGKRQLLEERLLAVVNAADDAIIGTDSHGIISDWNGGAARLYGYSHGEALGQKMGELIVAAESRALETRVRQAIAYGERVPHFDTVRRCKEGKLIHVSVTISPIFASDGHVVGSTAVEHDITAARAAEAGRRAVHLEEAEVMRLKGLDKMRRTFISEASHELNTPLTPVRIHLEALAERTDLNPQQREHIVVIERNVLRLSNLVKDMLEASRLETGRFKLDLEDVPLAAIVQETIQNLGEAAALAGVRLEPGPVANLVAGADRNRVGQVLYNLVNNAIGFTPKGGTITLTVVSDAGEALVRVTDTGLGLTGEQIAQLFQPFSRPHDGRGPGPRGTGLGLFISKGIVEQHGGRIWAESAGPGTGSSFCFALPLAGPRAQPVEPSAEPAAADPEGQVADVLLPKSRVGLHSGRAPAVAAAQEPGMAA